MGCLSRTSVPEAPPVPKPSASSAELIELRRSSPLDYLIALSGIPTVSEEAVERHKHARLDKLRNPKRVKIVVKEPFFSAVQTVSLWILSAIGAGLLMSVMSKGFELIAIGLGVILMIAIGTSWKMVTRMEAPPPDPDARWMRKPYAEYMAPAIFPVEDGVPQDIKNRADVLRSRLPGVELTVHYLKSDPILEASYAHPVTGEICRRYVGVWDEDGLIC